MQGRILLDLHCHRSEFSAVKSSTGRPDGFHSGTGRGEARGTGDSRQGRAGEITCCWFGTTVSSSDPLPIPGYRLEESTPVCFPAASHSLTLSQNLFPYRESFSSNRSVVLLKQPFVNLAARDATDDSSETKWEIVGFYRLLLFNCFEDVGRKVKNTRCHRS